MNITKLITFVGGIAFIIVLYAIIYYALKIMDKDVKSGGKNKNNTNRKKYGIEVVSSGGSTDLEDGTVIIIRGDITIGRNDENSIVLSDPFVSGRHAKLFIKNNDLFIEDLNSTNGVFVDDERIEGKVKLLPDDEIKIGSVIFKVLKSQQ